jgi:hypothetical protein
MLAKINARKKVLREPRAASMIGQVLDEYKDAIDANFTPTGAAASVRNTQHATRTTARHDTTRHDTTNDTTRAQMVTSRWFVIAQTSRQRGAMLSAVVGGKMSEGINFSDGLGRCVVMVGLPYPNPRDPVLVEKMKYISAKAAAAAASTSSSSSSSSSWSSSSSSPARRVMSAPVMSARQYYENACMRAVNQSIGRSIRHAGDYATILLVDHRYMRPEITSKLPRWIAATMPPCVLLSRSCRVVCVVCCVSCVVSCAHTRSLGTAPMRASRSRSARRLGTHAPSSRTSGSARPPLRTNVAPREKATTPTSKPSSCERIYVS